MALIKILKNTTGADITLRQVVIRAGSSYTIPPKRFDVWAADDVVDPYVTSGDIVVNDGTVDLSVAAGIRHLDKLSAATQVDVDLSPFQNISTDDDVQAVLPELIPNAQVNDVDVTTQINSVDFRGNVSVTDEGNGNATITIGTASPLGGIYALHFGDSGSVGNEYLENSISRRPTNEVPQIVPFNSKVIAYTYSNRDNDSDIDLKIYSVAENSANSPTILKDAWVLRNARSARKTNFPSDIVFNAGDKVTIYADDKGVNPDDVAFTIYLQITSFDSTEIVETWSSNINPISSGGGDDDDDDDD